MFVLPGYRRHHLPTGAARHGLRREALDLRLLLQGPVPRGSGHLSRAGLGVGTEAAVLFFSFFFWGGKFLNVVWETRMIIPPQWGKKWISFFLGVYRDGDGERKSFWGFVLWVVFNVVNPQVTPN